MQSEHTEIKDKGSELCLDERLMSFCFFCQNDWIRQGRPPNWKPTRSLSITRKSGYYLYNCYRATCFRGRGVVGGELRIAPMAKQGKVFIPKYCLEPVQPMPSNLGHTLFGQYELTKKDIDYQEVRYAPESKRVYYPIFDYRGYTIGQQLKQIEKGKQPKCVSYKHADVPLLHFPKGQTLAGPEIVLVEDIISAIKISKLRNCAALMGTNLTLEMIKQLTKIGKSSILMVLDSDAFNKALRLKQKYGELFDSFRVVPIELPHDPKHIEYAVLKEILK